MMRLSKLGKIFRVRKQTPFWSKNESQILKEIIQKERPCHIIDTDGTVVRNVNICVAEGCFRTSDTSPYPSCIAYHIY